MRKLLTVVFLLLTACTPLTPAPTPPPIIPTSTPELFKPVSWQDIPPQAINGTGYFGGRTPIYDHVGYLWSTSTYAVLRWDARTGQLTEFDRQNGFPGEQEIIGLTLFQDEVWVISLDGASRYQAGSWLYYPFAPDTAVYPGFYVVGDQLWAATNGGLVYFDGWGWEKFDHFPEDLEIAGNTYFASIAASQDGSLWFLANQYGLRFDGETWQRYDNLFGAYKTVTLSDGTLLFIFPSTILYEEEHELKPLVFPGDRYWYSTQSSFLAPDGDLQILDWYSSQTNQETSRYNTYIVHEKTVTSGNPLIIPRRKDRPANVPVALTPYGWVLNVGSAGFVLYDESGNYTELQIKSGQGVKQVIGNTVIGFSPDGALWTLDFDGLPIRFDGQQVQRLFERYPDVYPYRWLMDPDGSLWGISSGSTDRLVHYDVYHDKPLVYDLFFRVRDAVISPEGRIWVTSDAGFITEITPAFLKSGNFTDLNLIRIGEGLLYHRAVPSRILAGPSGEVLVFVRGSGLYAYEGSRWRFLGLARLQDPTALAVDSKGHVWSGECGKLVEYDGYQWLTHEVPCVIPAQLMAAANDTIWFVDTCQGEVYSFDGQQWTRLTRSDMGGFTPNSILQAPDGAIWLISPQKWLRYVPAKTN